MAKEIDWKMCAVALNSKLSAISARLQVIRKESPLTDVSFAAEELIDEFRLSSDEPSRLVDFVDLRSRLDEIGSMLCQYYFKPVSERSEHVSRIYEAFSSFSFDFSMFGAFLPLNMEENHGS